MRNRRWTFGVCLAAAAFSSPSIAQPLPPPAQAIPTPEARLGTIRVKIDPAVAEQEAEIRKMLGALPFVRIGEPADYLITTNPDFPLDLSLYDLQNPPTIWQHQYPEDHTLGEEPRQFAVGNLADPQTADRLATTLTAAARIRAVLDRSLASMQGVEACVVIAEPTGDAAPKASECVSMDQLGSRKIVFSDWVSAIRVRNASTSGRYVAIAAADINLMFGSAASDAVTRVVKLAPGQSAEFSTNIAIYFYSRDPRVFILASARPFGVDQLSQPAPLDPDKECEDPTAPGCQPNLSPVALNDDLAVRSIQLHVIPEPQPAMGGGSDVTARMAVWMAQFYSVIPFTPAEIAADSKLPDDKTQFLAHRTYEERQHRCGAALIGPNLVLTAAHCLAKDQYAGDGLAKVLKQRRVRLGSRKIGQGGQTFAIDGVAVHANYDPKRQNHDIALLLLKPDRASGSARPTPIAVAGKPLPGGVDALGFGWGLTGAVAPNGNIMLTLDARMQGNADVLQYGEMRSISLNECKRKFTSEVAAGMVCMYSKTALAGGQSRDGVFTCRGDSGGPLVRKIGGRDVLVGVVSWSKGCGYKNYPQVFTDAGSYAAWIAAARAELKPGAAIRPKDPARPH